MNIYRFLMLLLRFPELLVDPEGHFELEYRQGVCYPNNSCSRISWMHVTWPHVGTFEVARPRAMAVLWTLWELCYIPPEDIVTSNLRGLLYFVLGADSSRIMTA